MKIAIAGTGYVGLVTGVCLSEMQHRVICVDTDEKKIEVMKKGNSPIYEPGLDKMLSKNISEGRLYFTTDYQEAYKNANIIIIGVGTPERADGSANLDYIFKVCRQIADSIEKDCLVVIKSTVPVGTGDKIEEFLKENIKNNIYIEVASNPEFLSQGTAIYDTIHAKRIVIGVESRRAEEILRKVYERYNQPIVATSRKSAEMIKYAANDFLALKISFINEIANLCEIVGADIDEVTKGMGYDERIGKKFLKAGIGYGGSCFPKDTKALHWLANDSEYELKTIKATIEVNENQKYKLFRAAKKRFKSLKGLKVAVLGLSFKPGTDDLREAPSIPNIKRLLAEGTKVVAYDPVCVEKFKKIFPIGVKFARTIEETLSKADMAFIFTEWDEIKFLDLRIYEKLMNMPIIFDGRNCYDINKIRNRKIDYYSIGRMAIINIGSKLKEDVVAITR